MDIVTGKYITRDRFLHDNKTLPIRVFVFYFHYLMSQEQLKRYTVIQKTLEGTMTVKEAAEPILS
jgi:hypothetical protein